MHSLTDDEILALVEGALATETTLPRLPPALLEPYLASIDRLYRRTNRIALVLFTIVFNLFLISEFSSAPEVVPVSSMLRLWIYTPLVLLFLLMDKSSRPLSRRPYEAFMLLLACAPGLICAVICVQTTSTTTLSDVHATTLILLGVGLIYRMRLPAVAITALVSFTAFLVGLLLTPVIPRAELPTLIFTDLAIAMAVVSFSALLDRRDRLVFLLNLREQVRARQLALQNQGLRQQVDIDGLTGLANRRCFDQALAAAWEEAVELTMPIGLIMIDIDHFKLFNDHYGHLGGDSCLRRVARQGKRETRQGDLIARYGGEEFAVILHDTTLGAALGVAERLRAAVAELAIPHDGIGPGAIVSISLGAASMTPRPGDKPGDLIGAADRHLYMAKRQGRNRVSAGNAFDERTDNMVQKTL